jgi:phosphoglycerate dehydrogenase-like enzyme
LLAEAEIVVGHIWRRAFPPAPRLRLLQSVAAGLDLLDTIAVPKGVTICNVFGHEPAIAEYVIMTMLVLTHRLFEAVTTFRAGSWGASPQFGGGSSHGEVLGRTIGIIGYGRIGREVAERATGLKCRVVAANRTVLPRIEAGCPCSAKLDTLAGRSPSSRRMSMLPEERQADDRSQPHRRLQRGSDCGQEPTSAGRKGRARGIQYSDIQSRP